MKGRVRARVIVKLTIPNDLQTPNGIKMDRIKYYIEEALNKAGFKYPNVTEILLLSKPYLPKAEVEVVEK